MTTQTQNDQQSMPTLDVQQITQPLERAHARAKSLAPNTIEVWPGGAMFTSIQAAMDSIQNASTDLQYMVAIGSGTYTELVNLKDNVFMSGAGQNLTTLTRPGVMQIAGTLMTGGNCGAGMMTISSTGGAAGTNCTALYFAIDGTFTGTGLALTATDSGNAGNVVTCISNQNGADRTIANMASCNINAISTNNNSATCGIQLSAPGITMNIELSTVNAGGPGGVGILTSNLADVNVSNCSVTGQNWSLQNFDGNSQIIATGCTLNGPVTAGVIVNP